MRILSILPLSPPSTFYGGAERQMHSLHQALRQSGIEVHVLADISYVGKEYQEIDGLPVWGVTFPTLTAHPFRLGNIRFYIGWCVIRRTVLKRIPRPDLIQVSTFRQPALVGYWLASTLKVPWVVRLACSGSHGDLEFARSNWLSRRLFPQMAKSVARVIALDKQTSVEVIESGVPVERVSLIQNGLVFKRPPLFKGKEFSRLPLTILYLGRLTQQKRLDSLLTAFATLKKSIDGDHTLRIVGSGDQASLLSTHAAVMGIDNYCTFPGEVLTPEDELDRAHCFVNPSESEGLPNAVLEAAAFGLPLILSDIPIHRQIATDVGMTEYLYPVGDSIALAASLMRFIHTSIEHQTLLSQQCANFGRRFMPEIRDQAYLALYRSILKI